MARTRVRRRRAALFVTLAAIGGAWAGPLADALDGGADARPVSRSSYVVRPGDSVWDIAERVAPGADPRPLVDAIVDANAIDPGSLAPGQTIVIPAG